MRKIKISWVVILGMVLVLWAVPGWAIEKDWVRQSATQTGDAAVVTGPGVFHGIMVITDGTNAVTMDIYDNASAASGTKLIPTWTITTSSTNRAQTISFFPPVRFLNGIYVDITCAGTVAYMVYFNE
jgi:hypothetical protein